MSAFTQYFADLHFMRPWWLLGLVLIPIFLLIRRRTKAKSTGWDSVVAPELLKILIPESALTKLRRIFDIVASLALFLLVLALAGPAWQQLPQPVEQKNDNLVLVLDLSYSMYVQDIPPSRLVRAKHKITDILRNRDEGNAALVAYAGDAHIVTPLTHDNDTIQHLLASLDPSIMPVAGSDPASAVELALRLLENGTVDRGRILLLTDGIERYAELAQVQTDGVEVHILGIGTVEGGPIPVPTRNGRSTYLRDSSGNLVRPSLERERLQQYAVSTGGTYRDLSVDDSDIEKFFDGQSMFMQDTDRIEERQFDLWHDSGYLLIVPILVLAVFALRRGTIVVVFVLVTFDVHADWRDDLWSTRDQQGYETLRDGRPDLADSLFKNEEWQAVTKYRMGKYEESAKIFSSLESERSQFNLGNALARNGLFEEAIAAYDRVLDHDPQHEDAAFNKELIEQLLEEQRNESASQNQQDSASQSEQREQQLENADSSGEQRQAQQSEGDTQHGENEEQQMQQSTQGDNSEDEKREISNEGTANESQEERESADKFERWIRRVPDEPGNLLYNKFRYESETRRGRGELERDSSRNRW